MTQYLKQIDALRFYAVFGVMISHLYPKEFPTLSFVKEFYSYLPGVPLFFCISGFLITGILISHSSQPRKKLLKNFYARRFLRIFPIYYLTILALFVVNIEDYRSWFVYDLFYVSNIVQGIQGDFAGSVAPHFWSLAVEEQFYILWPLLIILVRNKTYQFAITLMIFLTGTLLMIFSENQFLMARTLGCLAYLGSGALLAYLWYYYKEKILKLTKVLDLVLIIFVFLVALNSFGFLIAGPKMALLTTILLIPLVTIRFAIGFKNTLIKLVVENPLIVYLGKISYGIYIFHLLALFPAVAIKYFFNLTFLDNLWAMFFFKIGLTILISAISWEFFEKRINRFKNKFDYK